MTFVNVNPNTDEPTHDAALTDGRVKYGLMFDGDEKTIQQIPISPPQQDLFAHQNTFVGGRGRRNFSKDPTGYFDASGVWTFVDEKLLLSPKYYFAQGYRNADTYWPDGLTFKPLIGAKRYISAWVTASASYNADKALVWVRKVGTPKGALTLSIYASTGTAPNDVPTGSALKTATISADDILSFLAEFDWAGTYASWTSGTRYHLVVSGASGDTRANHWEVGVGTAYSNGGKISADGSSWTSVNYRLAFRIVDDTTYVRRKNRKWFPFSFYGGLYSVNTASLFVNGDRGTATAGTANSLTTNKNFGGTTRFVGARIRIIDGTGDGQDRLISAHTSGANSVITPSENFDTAPDNTSVYIIYGTNWWTSLAGHGLTAVTARPVSAHQICYFPQDRVAVRKMRLNAGTHEYNTATILASFLEINTPSQSGVQLARAIASNSTMQIVSAPTDWATDPAAGTLISVGTKDTRITGLLSHENYVYVLKEDNIYKMDGNTPKGFGAPGIIDSNNGFASVSKPPGFYFSWGNSVFLYSSGTAKDILNYRPGYSGLPSDRTGSISWIDAGVPWLFHCVDGGASNYSSVLMYNEIGFMEVFRGWKKGERIDSIAWQTNEGVSPRLWIFIGNDIVYIDFPYNNNNPLNDTSIKYMHEGYLETSEYDADDPVLAKLFHRFSVLSEGMNTANKKNTLGAQNIQMQMKLNGETSWRNVGTSYASPVSHFNLNVGEAVKVRLRLILRTNSASTTPVLTAWGINGWKANELKYQFVGQYKTSSRQKTHSKEEDHDPKALTNKLMDWSVSMKKLTYLSIDPALHGKTVIISAPAIVKHYLREPKTWEGAFSLYIREA